MSAPFGEKPIACDRQEVQALLSRRKTRFTRVVGLPRYGGRRSTPDEWAYLLDHGMLFLTQKSGVILETKSGRASKRMQDNALPHPFGDVGSVRYVQERFFEAPTRGERPKQIWYEADAPVGPVVVMDETQPTGCRIEPWIVAKRMLPDDSRLKLVTIAVRVERLSEITEEDALAEGISQAFSSDNGPDDSGPHVTGFVDGPPGNYSRCLLHETARAAVLRSWELRGVDPLVFVAHVEVRGERR